MAKMLALNLTKPVYLTSGFTETLEMGNMLKKSAESRMLWNK